MINFIEKRTEIQRLYITNMCEIINRINEKYNSTNNLLDELSEESVENIDNRINQFIEEHPENYNSMYKLREEPNETHLIEAYPYLEQFIEQFIEPFTEYFEGNFIEQYLIDCIEKCPEKRNTINDSNNIIQNGFLNKLYILLSNQQKYSHIIFWEYNNDNKIVIILKEKMEVSKILCPRSCNLNFSACLRQLNNYSFHSFQKNKCVYVTHPTLENINDIINIRKYSKKSKKRKMSEMKK